MDRIDRIMAHPMYRQMLMEVKLAEESRIFCKHGMGHLLDVARIAWIMNLEEGAGLEKDIVYAAAFLHDIGKAKQYKEGVPHEITSGELAESILPDCGFLPEETENIKTAILSHRDKGIMGEKSLRGILYRADKASRACYDCKAFADCNWPAEKKNLGVNY